MTGGYTSVYANVAQKTDGMEDLEAGALIRMASKINDVRRDFENRKGELADLLERNRKLWSVLICDLGSEDNKLPPEIKQNVANLAYFVFKHTLRVLSNPSARALGVFIDINMNIAKGLSSDRRANRAAGIPLAGAEEPPAAGTPPPPAAAPEAPPVPPPAAAPAPVPPASSPPPKNPLLKGDFSA